MMATVSVQANPRQRHWLELLACPQCRAELATAEYCVACGLSFDCDGGVPVLISDKCSRTVKFDYAQRRSVSDDELAKVLREPPKAAADGDLPYHFDPAHAMVAQNLPHGANVLEIGCGGGQCRAWFQRHGHHYVGTDISRSRVSETLRTHGGPDLLADAHFLPFKDASFDMVYSAAVTEHLACPVLMAQEVRRVLKRGGCFCGNVSFMEPWHDSSFYHMTPLGVHELLVAAGFEVRFIWPGDDWDAHRAISRMAFAGPFQFMRPLGRAADGVYALQVALQRWRRRIKGRPVDSMALRSRIAGAVTWIATRGNSDEALPKGAGEEVAVTNSVSS